MSNFIDPYIDLETNILRNLVGATSYTELHQIEADLVTMAEISLEKIPHTRDLLELQRIHKYLFDRIYDWAGELRTVNIRKGSAEYFLDYNFLENGAQFVFDELRQKDYFQRMKRETLVKCFAYFYEQLNFIHPFREGNGRTQRIFWQRITNEAGYKIDWSKVIGQELDNASLIGRTENNLEPLEQMFDRIVNIMR